ncbi:MAG: DUF790 family protein [Halobacteriota archaeon]
MLPSNLLIVRSRQGKIRPVYVPVEEGHLELASHLIEAYEAHVGKRKGELIKRLQAFEAIGFDYRLVRGLCALLDRSATFTPYNHVDPRLARREVFTEANRYTLVASHETRQQVIAQAALRLEISPAELEESLWSDWEEQLVLECVVPPSPQELLQQYNLSLTQTLFFKAVSLEFTAGSNYQQIFRRLKYLGLMYSVEKGEDADRVLVDGPASLFKMTDRYGTALAKLLPSIVEAERWSLEASIVGGDRHAPKLLRFVLNSEIAEDLFKAQYAEETKERYDSTVEAKFARSFNALRLGWTLKREPELLRAGRYVFLPDFAFEKNGMKAYLEVVGFWTDEYLKKKLEKLRNVDVKNLLIAVDGSLGCTHFEGVKGQVIFYNKKVPLKPIVDYLKHVEEHAIAHQVASIDVAKLKLEGDLIDAKRLAEEQSVSVDALLHWLKANPVAQYRLIGSVVISERRLENIDDKLQKLDGCTLSEALDTVAAAQLPFPEKILDALGYVVDWNGLDPDTATIRKRGINAAVSNS